MNFDLDAFSAVINTLVPVFAIVFLGAVLRATGFLTEAFSTVLNKFVFWIPLPCMIIHTIKGSEIGADCFDTAAVLMLSTLVIGAIAWWGAKWFGIQEHSRGSFTQSVFRSNNAYIGIPVMLMAYQGHSNLQQVASLAMLTLAPCLILYNVLAVIVLTPSGTGSRAKRYSKLAKGIVTNPLIIACVAGGFLFFTKFELPRGIDNTIKTLGDMATSGALVALGASLTPDRLRSAMRGANVVSFLKLVVCPLIGLGFSMLFGLSPEGRFVALIYLACPSAVASFVMAQAMKGDSVLAGGAVALSTVYSVISLAVVLLFTMP